MKREAPDGEYPGAKKRLSTPSLYRVSVTYENAPSDVHEKFGVLHSPSIHACYSGLFAISRMQCPALEIGGHLTVEFLKVDNTDAMALFDGGNKVDRLWILEYVLKRCLKMKKELQQSLLLLRRQQMDFCPLFVDLISGKPVPLKMTRAFVSSLSLRMEIPEYSSLCTTAGMAMHHVEQSLQGMVVLYKNTLPQRIDGLSVVYSADHVPDFSKSIAFRRFPSEEEPPDFLFPKFCKLSGIKSPMLHDLLGIFEIVPFLALLTEMEELLFFLDMDSNPLAVTSALERFLHEDTALCSKIAQFRERMSPLESLPHRNLASSPSSPTPPYSFLGTSLLQYALGAHVYHLYPEWSEGQLTSELSRLNSHHLRDQWADKLHLPQFAGPGLSKKQSSTALEAVVSSVFLEKGLLGVESVVNKLLGRTPSQCALPKTSIVSSHALQQAVETTLQVSMNQPSLLDVAFTHSSFDASASNERLEFLGDLVLEVSVSLHLFSMYKLHSISELPLLRSMLVRNETLTTILQDLGLDRYINISRVPTNSTKFIADAFEALIGALFLDQGWACVHSIVQQHVMSRLDLVLANRDHMNPKNKLQELLHFRHRNSSLASAYPKYETKTLHISKKFQCTVSFDGCVLGQGIADTKADAEKEAARKALLAC